MALFSDERERFQDSNVWLWLDRLNKQETHAAKEDREMSREINEAHSTEVTLQKQNGTREHEREREREREDEHSSVNVLHCISVL